MSSQTKVDDILASIAGLQVATYIHVSSAALLLADWFFTLDLEVNYAWNAGAWHLGRILFFITRYSVFIDTSLTLYHQVGYSIPVSSCALTYNVGGWVIIFGVILAEFILTIRVWALWGRRMDMGIFLVVQAVVECTVAGVAYGLYGPSYTFIAMDSLSPTIPGCFLNSGGKTLLFCFIMLMVHQTIIFSLTVIKGIQHYRIGVYGVSLIQTFYRDGATYYAVLFALSVINLAALSSEFDIAYSNLLTSIQRVFHSILSARMLLHLRQEADIRQSTRENMGSLTVDELAFKRSFGLSLTSNIDLTTRTDTGSYTRDDGWFGQDKSASPHPRRTTSEVC